MKEFVYLKLNELTRTVNEQLKSEVKKSNACIKLASIIMGENPASQSYLKGMQKSAEKLGLAFEIIKYPADLAQAQLKKNLNQLNQSGDYTGLIIQIPLPDQIDFFEIAACMNEKKDVDAITPYNLGRLFMGTPLLVPAVAYAVDLSLDYIEKKFSYPLKGKNAVIIGRSNTVGKPVFHLLLKKNITPTIVHTRTENIQQIVKRNDIIIAACGVKQLINENWIKDEAVIIDVGMHSIKANNEKGYQLCGDVEHLSVSKKAALLTAVPGGIGALTSALIFANCVKSWYLLNHNQEFNFHFEF